MEFYSLRAPLMGAEEICFDAFRDRILLIVNTASKCGFTEEFGELEALYKKYQKDGLVILGFPCNQFREQDPESNEEIEKFCRTKYHVTFPMFEKVDVKGPGIHPVFEYLTEQKGFSGLNMDHPLAEKLDNILRQENPAYAQVPDIKWNFTKFLIDRKGAVVARFDPTVPISAIEEGIQVLLSNDGKERNADY